ncbi:hypothetical protein [Clostridium sp. JN-9]|uniref:YczE/YyaS/YitT family protein n=1 Tax=Clostridium sp. JN-9 TaxID=2507159 RepID=UPI000FFE2D7A|nr:hypothetical protein [Clostridium sp. JN-9]QAT40477.1 hypothetical protein EQM05_09485 [Clostridium sp. JN-9]
MIKENIKSKIILALAGVVILAFAIALLIKVGFGLSAWDAFYANLAAATGLTFGFFSYFVGSILIMINTVISHKRYNWSALLMSFLIGNCVDIFNKIFANSFNLQSFIARVIIFIIGIIIYGLGISLLIYSGLPSPLEEFQFAIQKLSKVSIGTSKFLSDFTALILAIIVGIISKRGLGQISIATIIITLVVGKVVGTWITALTKINLREKIIKIK